MRMRPYQMAAFNSVEAAFADGARRVLLVMPTGTGKTILFSHATAAWGSSTLIAAHRRELVRQASAKLAVPHGIIAPGHLPTRRKVQVGSVQTLARRLAILPKFDHIVLDEAHHAVAGSWAALLAAQPDALVLGVTATPERLDGRGLGDVFDAIVFGPTTAECIADGYLSPYDAYGTGRPSDVAGLHMLAGDYNPVEAAGVMDRPAITGDAVSHYGKFAAGLPAVAFCCTVAHAEHVAADFRREGWNFVAVNGTTPEAERDQAFADLASGRIIGITSCSLIDEGLDIPNISCVIDLAPTASLSRFLQRGGRMLRPVFAPGFDTDTREGRLAAIAAGPKTRAVFLDHASNMGTRHGWLDAPRGWSLAGKKRRASTPTAIQQCPECYAIHKPSHVCVSCGFDYSLASKQAVQREIEVKAGVLALMSPADQKTLYFRETSLAQLVSEADTYETFEEIAKARGYKIGWVTKQMAFKQSKFRQVQTFGREFLGR